MSNLDMFTEIIGICVSAAADLTLFNPRTGKMAVFILNRIWDNLDDLLLTGQIAF